ncbi:MAG: 50S ribosomal protein L2 [Patescibacteria group bacterium]|nr:50S ribosomal protein L2 [Patescibacteria group bacterium]MCL5093980.1 50S ribosomal protein L2 [Patescibacteria group bacterium]
MAIKKLKPVTSAQRGMTKDAFEDITKKTPEKSLVRIAKKSAGRNAQGKITVRHRGGGAKRKYRMVSFKNPVIGRVKVVAIEYDPNRSARLALVETEDGKKYYVIAPQKVKVGGTIEFGEEAEVRIGNRLPLAKIPTGTVVYNVELVPGGGAKLARSAGTSVQILAKEGRFAHLKLPSGEVRLIEAAAYASVGMVSNPDHANIKIGKAGRKRHMGIRPTVLGKSMNPVDHPHGGGEGHSPVGLTQPKTPWGAPALGFKTRNRKKKSNKLIIKSRKK